MGLNDRLRLYCHSKMMFISKVDGKHRAYFKHYKGKIGDKCKNTKYISPDNNRAPEIVQKIVLSQRTIGVKGHKYKPKSKKPNKNLPIDNTAGPPSEENKISNKTSPTKPIVKEDPNDLSVEEILEQIILGTDWSGKDLFFYGRSRPFNDVFINVHKISSQRRWRLNDGMPRVFWGDFYKICCNKEGRNCDVCRIEQTEWGNYEVMVFCGESPKNEPTILFTEQCSGKLLKRYKPLSLRKPKGYLAVISDDFEPKRHHPKIHVKNFRGNVCYLEQPMM